MHFSFVINLLWFRRYPVEIVITSMAYALVVPCSFSAKRQLTENCTELVCTERDDCCNTSYVFEILIIEEAKVLLQTRKMLQRL